MCCIWCSHHTYLVSVLCLFLTKMIRCLSSYLQTNKKYVLTRAANGRVPPPPTTLYHSKIWGKFSAYASLIEQTIPPCLAGGSGSCVPLLPTLGRFFRQLRKIFGRSRTIAKQAFVLIRSRVVHWSFQITGYCVFFSQVIFVVSFLPMHFINSHRYSSF
jgi:hypothetical protein